MRLGTDFAFAPRMKRTLERRSADDALWRTDGTALGTFFLRTFVSRITPEPLFDAPELGLVFTAGDGARFGLWRTDGQPEGTVFVALHRFSP